MPRIFYNQRNPLALRSERAIFIDHPMINAAPTCRGMLLATAPTPRQTPLRTPLAITGRQKLVMSLRDAGYTFSEIAARLGIRHPETVYRTYARGKAAAKQIRQMVDRVLEGGEM
jgi:hypothetical protein